MACKHCWSREETKHNPACPIAIGTNEAMEKWREGYSKGFFPDFDESRIEATSLCRYYDTTWALGYRAGDNDLEGQIDAAAQARCFG